MNKLTWTEVLVALVDHREQLTKSIAATDKMGYDDLKKIAHINLVVRRERTQQAIDILADEHDDATECFVERSDRGDPGLDRNF